MGMGFAPTWLRQVSPPASENHWVSPLLALALAPTVDPALEVLDPALEVLDPALEVLDPALEVLDPALEVLTPAPDEIVGRQSRETPAATLLLLRASFMYGSLLSSHERHNIRSPWGIFHCTVIDFSLASMLVRQSFTAWHNAPAPGSQISAPNNKNIIKASFRIQTLLKIMSVYPE